MVLHDGAYHAYSVPSLVGILSSAQLMAGGRRERSWECDIMHKRERCEDFTSPLVNNVTEKCTYWKG